MSQTYSATTRGIRVDVEPTYLADRSDPDRSQWVWAYEITITNGGNGTVQLQERTWEITDGNGKVDHVHGPGVVGEQPILNGGDVFRYSSGCPLRTPSGFMSGFYTFTDEADDRFDVAVPPFSLDLPHAARALN